MREQFFQERGVKVGRSYEYFDTGEVGVAVWEDLKILTRKHIKREDRKSLKEILTKKKNRFSCG